MTSLFCFRCLLAALVLAFGLCCAAPVVAADFIFVRPGDPERIFRQDDALVIELPANLSDAEVSSLFVELDGIDITQRVTLEGTRAVFYPASPYAAGGHVLRLVRLGRNGKLVEIDRWQFQVTGVAPPLSRETSVEGNIDAVYTARVWDNTNDNTPEPDVQNLQAQGSLDVATQKGAWRYSLRGNAFANSERTLNPSGDGVEVGEYLLRAETSGRDISGMISLGNHDIGVSNLLMDQFYRRGVSGVADLWQGRAQLAGFVMNPAAATGNRNALGLEFDRQRVTGLHTTLSPFAALGDRLTLEATGYDGKGDPNGSGTGSAVGGTVQDASGYQLGLRSTLVKDVAALRMQYARSHVDADQADPLVRKEDNAAYGIDLTLTPLKSSTDAQGRLRQWEIEPGYYRAGTYFSSLLNPSLESDREIWRIKSRYLYGNFSLEGEAAWITDNVNDHAGLPHDRSLQIFLQGSWSPENETWGSPVFSFGSAFSDDNRRKEPSGFVGTGLDSQTRSVNGGVVLSFERITWSMNHTYTNMADGTAENIGYDSHYTDLGLEYRLSENLTLRPGFQFELLTQDATGTSRNAHVSLGAQAVIIPDKLWNNTNYSMQINNGNTAGGRNYNLESEFNWLFKQAEVNAPGYALAFSGIYSNTRAAADQEPEDLRLFLRLKLSAPFALR